MRAERARSRLLSPTLFTTNESHYREIGSLAEPAQLDRAKIEEAFRLMGQYLLDRNALGEIVIYGGGAILLQFDWRLRSQDVDVRVIAAGNHGSCWTRLAMRRHASNSRAPG
jgi:hypothetical protein